MSPKRNKLTAQQSHIWTLRMILAALLVLLGVSQYHIQTKVTEIRAHVPPDLSSGAALSHNKPHPANAYIFSRYIFLRLNDWEDGNTDFKKHIESYECYVSSRYKKQLMDTYHDKRKKGELTRTRRTKPLGSYSDSLVSTLSSNTYLVWLDVNITEEVNNYPVKDINVRYPIRVTTSDRPCNKMGLELDGYEYTPEQF